VSDMNIRYYHLDHLGTPRLITGPHGSLIARHAYLPFGGQLSPTTQEHPRREDPMKFTGHERDAVTGLDYMHARYYSGGLGRFLSVDPVWATGKALKGPQRWNRYAYVINNPLRYNDPDGRETNPVTGTSGISDAELRHDGKGTYNYPRANASGIHGAADIAVPLNTPLFAPISGIVTLGHDPAKGGHWIRITGQTDDGKTIAVHMSHLAAPPNVKKDSQVLEGQPNIALSGNSGNAKGTPPHVHVAVFIDGKRIKPQPWFAANPSRNVYAEKKAAVTADEVRPQR
jgi:RHS repeat-associated protein